MGILIGILLVSLGIGGLIGFLPYITSPFPRYGLLTTAVFLGLIISGIILIYLSYRKSKRNKLSQLNMRIKNQCPRCHTNVTDDCPQCPRCGMNL